MTTHNAGTAAGLSPNDTSAYYWGQFTLFNPSTSAASQRTTIERPCQITDVRWISIVQSLTGSTNNVTLSVFKNDTTSFTLGTQQWNTSTGTTYNNLSIPFNKGDDFSLRFDTPAWSTNPTGVILGAQLWWTSR
jgi:hypothetical protein